MTCDTDRDTIKESIDLGYRLFDTAHVHENEGIVGTGIRDKIKEGKIKRKDVFVITKVNE